MQLFNHISLACTRSPCKARAVRLFEIMRPLTDQRQLFISRHWSFFGRAGYCDNLLLVIHAIFCSTPALPKVKSSGPSCRECHMQREHKKDWLQRVLSGSNLLSERQERSDCEKHVLHQNLYHSAHDFSCSLTVLAYTCTSACSVSNSRRPEQSSKCTHQNYSLLDETAMKMFLATTTEYSIFNAVTLPASICSNYCAALCRANRERSADIK